jgi:WD40 repeat protein
MKSIALPVLAGCIVAITPAQRDLVLPTAGPGPMLTNRASFDGRRLLLAGWDDPTASLWDIETGLRIVVFTGHAEGVRAVAFSPDGQRVLTGAGGNSDVIRSNDSSVRLWDANSGRELRRFDELSYPAWTGPVLEVAFTENGREVMGAGSSRGLSMWDAATGELLFQQPTNSFASLDSVRGPRVMTRGPGDWVRTWDYRSGARLASIERAALTAAARAWSAAAPEEKRKLTRSEEVGYITCSRWSPDGRMLVIASGRLVSTWDSVTGQLVRILALTSPVSDVMFNSDGKRMVTAAGAGVQVSDVSSDRLLTQLVHEGEVERVIISPDGAGILSEWTLRQGGRQTTHTSLWDIDSRRELVRFDQRQKPVGFSPDGGTIPVVDGLTFSNHCCRLDSLWDARSGKRIRQF